MYVWQLTSWIRHCGITKYNQARRLIFFQIFELKHKFEIIGISIALAVNYCAAMVFFVPFQDLDALRLFKEMIILTSHNEHTYISFYKNDTKIAQQAL